MVAPPRSRCAGLTPLHAWSSSVHIHMPPANLSCHTHACVHMQAKPEEQQPEQQSAAGSQSSAPAASSSAPSPAASPAPAAAAVDKEAEIEAMLVSSVLGVWCVAGCGQRGGVCASWLHTCQSVLSNPA